MAEIRTTHLMTMKLAVNGMQAIGATPNGGRRVGLVAVGTGSRPPEGPVYDVFEVL